MHTLKALRPVLPLLLLLWPAAAAAQTGRRPWHDLLTSVAVSPDGRRFAVAGLDGTVKLWDAGARASVATFVAHVPYVYAVAFSPDGKTLASGGSDRMIKLWEAGTGRPLRHFGFHRATVESLAFSPDGKTLASGDHFGDVRLWDLASGQPRVLEQDGRAASHLTFSADGKLLASGGDDSAFVWEAATGRRLAVFRVKRLDMTALTLSPDGRMGAAAGCMAPGFWGKLKCSIRVWDAATGRELRSMDAPPGLERLAFSLDNRLIASANATTDVRLWDASTGAKVGTLEFLRGLAYGLAFDADAKKVTAVREWAGRPSLVAWDVATRKLSSSPADLLPPMETAGAVKEPATAEQPASPGTEGVGVELGVGVGEGFGPGRGVPGGGGTGISASDDGPVDYTHVFRASQVDEKARITSKPEPSYTERARRHYITGKLRLRVVLNASGEVGSLVVMSELPFFLTDEAIRAARAIKFVPATKDGRPVSQYIVLEYNFNIY